MQKNISSTTPEIIRRQMNECGAAKKPYLFIINYEMDEGYFVENPLEQSELQFVLNGIGNKPATQKPTTNGNLTVSPIPPQAYKEMFDIVQAGIKNGQTVLTNLTVKTPIQTDLSLEAIFLSANTQYQLFVPEKFVCFSPECFVRIENGKIATFPMKGTINASIPNAEHVILNDSKELSEHQSAVELLMNDLRLSGSDNMRVTKFRYIDKLKTSEREILQVSSEIVGDLGGDYLSRLGDIIFAMLPGGSIAGAPKISTMEVIRNAEKQPRGFYTGVFGYFDGEKLDSGVLIRFIEEENGRKFFRSGGGITEDSDWEREYDEVLNKIYLPK